MQRLGRKQLTIAVDEPSPKPGLAIADFVGTDGQGVPMVVLKGEAQTKAKFLSHLEQELTQLQGFARVVVLLQEQAEPVIVGVIASRTGDASVTNARALSASADTIGRLGKRRIIAAHEELQIVCGSSSIVLHSNGKVVIKGRNVTTRASNRNRIKGSSVNIN